MYEISNFPLLAKLSASANNSAGTKKKDMTQNVHTLFLEG